MIRILFLSTVFSLYLPTASAMSWQELQSEIDLVESGGQANPATVLRLSDMVSMMVVMVKAEHEELADQQLFCPPQGKSFDLDGITSLMRKHVRDQPELQDASVQQVLLASMQHNFPC